MITEKKKKSERTRRKIMDSYMHLMNNKDYDKITVCEIVEEAGITRSTFYVYFEDVFDMLSLIEDELLNGAKYNYEPDTPAKNSPESKLFIENSEIWFEYCRHKRSYLLPLMGDHGDPYFSMRLRKRLNEHFCKQMDAEGLTADDKRPYFVEFLSAAAVGLLLYWLHDDCNPALSARELACISDSVRYASTIDKMLLHR